jgi:uncharacterized protein YfaS (alpha-2-macroglobulin family)
MATKRKRYATKSENVETGTVLFTFSHGDVLRCPVNSLPFEMLHLAALHGVKQKVGDSYGSHADVHTSEQAYTVAVDTWERLLRGDWNMTERAAVPTAYILKAIASIRDKDINEVTAIWESLSIERQTNIKTDAKVIAEAKRIMATERSDAVSSAPTDAILDEDF